MPLDKDLRELLGLLNSNKVEYLVVGAFAVAFHGFARYTADLDLMVRASADNAERTMRALTEFGFGNIGVKSEDFQSPDRVVQLGVPPNRVDLLTGISGVGFDEAWATRVAGELAGIAVQYIGREALLRNKESTGRAKDLGDAEELRKRPADAPGR